MRVPLYYGLYQCRLCGRTGTKWSPYYTTPQDTAELPGVYSPVPIAHACVPLLCHNCEVCRRVKCGESLQGMNR
jgi:hypothetical protein